MLRQGHDAVAYLLQSAARRVRRPPIASGLSRHNSVPAKPLTAAYRWCAPREPPRAALHDNNVSLSRRLRPRLRLKYPLR